MTDTSRQAFEEYARIRNFELRRGYHDAERYGEFETQLSWSAWQASRAQALDEAAQCLLESGFRSTGIPAYESLAEKVRKI